MDTNVNLKGIDWEGPVADVSDIVLERFYEARPYASDQEAMEFHDRAIERNLR